MRDSLLDSVICEFDLSELRAKKRLERQIDEEWIIALDVNNGIVVFSDVCPHVGGPLHEGVIQDNTIVCPWHQYRFDLTTGEVKGRPREFATEISTRYKTYTPGLHSYRLKLLDYSIKDGRILVSAGRVDNET